MTTAVVFDYGFGNVRSMVRALTRLGVDTALTSDHRQALDADGLVVPGVGAFAACMAGLKRAGGDRVIAQRVREGRPVLGVCVGEQVMFGLGREHGVETPGLGLIEGSVDPLDADVVPHMGWDTLEEAQGSALLAGIEDERFYFVHSYAAHAAGPASAEALGVDLSGASEHVTWCRYGRSRFVAAYERGPLSATQFHPEKSGDAGAQLLENWIGTF